MSTLRGGHAISIVSSAFARNILPRPLRSICRSESIGSAISVFADSH